MILNRQSFSVILRDKIINSNYQNDGQQSEQGFLHNILRKYRMKLINLQLSSEPILVCSDIHSRSALKKVSLYKMSNQINPQIDSPLYVILGEIAALWALAMVGYYFALPLFGYQLSYNSAPIVIAGYYLLWAAVSIAYFWNIFKRHLPTKHSIWISGLLSLGFAGLVWVLIYFLSKMPDLQGPLHAPYTDILFATSWYFLPKALEILVQQILITVLVFELYHRFKSLKDVIIGYAVCFGGTHILMYSITGAPTFYALIMIIASVLSAFIFPYFILKIRGGLVYTYAIHLIFYVILGIILHTWALPGYALR